MAKKKKKEERSFLTDGNLIEGWEVPYRLSKETKRLRSAFKNNSKKKKS